MTTPLSRPEAVQKYFTEPPTPVKPDKPWHPNIKNTVGIGGGLFLLGVILWSSGQAMFIAALMVLLGILCLFIALGFNGLIDEYKTAYKKYEEDCAEVESRPTDKQMDDWLKTDIRHITSEALRRLDLEDEDCAAEPLSIGGPVWIKETKFALGKDGKIRYSHFTILIVFLTEYHIATYKCDCTLVYGQILSDETKEFPYREITNLGTQVVKHQIDLYNKIKEAEKAAQVKAKEVESNSQQTSLALVKEEAQTKAKEVEEMKIKAEKGVQVFILQTSGGNTISVSYRFARDADSEGKLAEIGNERTITAIRKKLQDYKQKYER